MMLRCGSRMELLQYLHITHTRRVRCILHSTHIRVPHHSETLAHIFILCGWMHARSLDGITIQNTPNPAHNIQRGVPMKRTNQKRTPNTFILLSHDDCGGNVILVYSTAHRHSCKRTSYMYLFYVHSMTHFCWHTHHHRRRRVRTHLWFLQVRARARDGTLFLFDTYTICSNVYTVYMLGMMVLYGKRHTPYTNHTINHKQ